MQFGKAPPCRPCLGRARPPAKLAEYFFSASGADATDPCWRCVEDSSAAGMQSSQSNRPRRSQEIPGLRGNAEVAPDESAASPLHPGDLLRSEGSQPNPLKIWSGRRDSNSRPSDWKSDALPTELRPRHAATIQGYRQIGGWIQRRAAAGKGKPGRYSVNTTVLRPCRNTRSSRWWRSARASTRRSMSRPLRTRSSGVSRWLMRSTCCSMIGPSSRSDVT